VEKQGQRFASAAPEVKSGPQTASLLQVRQQLRQLCLNLTVCCLSGRSACFRYEGRHLLGRKLLLEPARQFAKVNRLRAVVYQDFPGARGFSAGRGSTA
jgi:hypothetical protein